jgi:hypothetical protein
MILVSCLSPLSICAGVASGINFFSGFFIIELY